MTDGKTSKISVCKLVEQLRCCICKYMCQPKWFRRTVEVRILSLIQNSHTTIRTKVVQTGIYIGAAIRSNIDFTFGYSIWYAA